MTNLKDLNIHFNELEVDPELGNYYVSVTDAGKLGLLLGPFFSHREALDHVEMTRKYANEIDMKSWFYAFGTVKMPDEYEKPGLFNDYFGI